LSVAIYANFERGIIDYNNIFNFSDNNILWNNNLDTMIIHGKYLYKNNPRLNIDINPNINVLQYSSYILHRSSEMFGAGQFYKNIGIFGNNIMYKIKHYNSSTPL
jgi:hypothetical protein